MGEGGETEQWNRMESPETASHSLEWLRVDKGIKTTHQKKAINILILTDGTKLNICEKENSCHVLSKNQIKMDPKLKCKSCNFNGF